MRELEKYIDDMFEDLIAEEDAVMCGGNLYKAVGTFHIREAQEKTRQALAQQAKDFEREKEIAVLERKISVLKGVYMLAHPDRTFDFEEKILIHIENYEQQLKKLKEQHGK
jgi:chaperonin cofactor prefoldin